MNPDRLLPPLIGGRMEDRREGKTTIFTGFRETDCCGFAQGPLYLSGREFSVVVPPSWEIDLLPSGGVLIASRDGLTVVIRP